ncbi:MAG: hypothetical protein ABH858_02700, partial [Candidatus Omnitrophota bacterium]
MVNYFLQRKGRVLSKFIGFFVVICLAGVSIFIYSQKEEERSSSYSYASVLPYMPAPNELITKSPEGDGVLLLGIRLYPDDPFKFDFIIDQGHENIEQEKLRDESARIIKYFLSALTIPEEDLWVNLSPYEQDEIAADELGLTDMGKDMLGEDYVLKQLLSSLTYPESALGKEFWSKVYKRAQALFGTTKVPINTFNKIWIVPEWASVYEDKDRAFIGGSRLKVMLEEDYLALKNNLDNGIVTKGGLNEEEIKDVNNLASSVTKEVVLPVIEDEVNYGKNFAILRQIFRSVILAAWFKTRLRESIEQKIKDNRKQKTDSQENIPILQRIFVDKKKIKGIEVDDEEVKEKIYNQYLEAYKKGVYNYVKKDYDPSSGRYIKRQYYSGGINWFGGASS